MNERVNSHGASAEPWLEHRLAAMRQAWSLRCLRRLAGNGALCGVDLGCGFHGRFVAAANRIPGVRFGGGDIQVDPGNTDLFRFDFRTPTPLPQPLDVITLHAVLEHLDRPDEVIRFLAGQLRPGGTLLLTVPSKAAQPVLEFLAFRLGVISAAEIRDHKTYYDRASLLKLLQIQFAPVRHQYFQLGMNNRVLARKR